MNAQDVKQASAPEEHDLENCRCECHFLAMLPGHPARHRRRSPRGGACEAPPPLKDIDMDKIDVNALVEVHKKGLVTVERFQNGAVHLLGPIEVLLEIRVYLWRTHRLNATIITKETITSTDHAHARYGATPKDECPAEIEVPTGRAPRIELHPSVVAPARA